jgi:hypothetical protein
MVESSPTTSAQKENKRGNSWEERYLKRKSSDDLLEFKLEIIPQIGFSIIVISRSYRPQEKQKDRAKTFADLVTNFYPQFGSLSSKAAIRSFCGRISNVEEREHEEGEKPLAVISRYLKRQARGS